MSTLGQRIAELRSGRGIKQNELAERLGVSAQAVSKWENDVSCPDISALPQLAEELGVTVDELLTGKEREPVVRMMTEEERNKKLDSMVFRVIVDSGDGDRVRVNLPMPLVRAGLAIGVSVPQVTENAALGNIDMAEIVKLVEQGLVGKLVEVDSADGDHAEIFVE